MKKLHFLLMALCLNVLAMQAQEKQVFTIDGYVVGDVTDSCYNIYLADEYFKIDESSKPVATVPVVNKRFTYSIPLDKMTAGRIRGISSGGELCSTWIDLFFVPGETVKLMVHKGVYGFDRPYSYRMKINRAVEAIRKETNWQSPHLPKVKGESWKNVTQDEDKSPFYWIVKDVIFNDEETVLQILHIDHLDNMNIGKESYLQDEDGNTYKLKRALMGQVDENNSPDIHIFGGYYAFEPMPKGTKSFSFHNARKYNWEGKEFFDFEVMRDIHKAAKVKKQKPNFDMNVNVSQGIGDSGYLVCLYDRNNGHSRSQIDDIPVKERTCSFSTYIDKPYLADLFATFPDGSVCTHCVRLPFVPGEHVDVKVMNGGFYLNGSKFYKDWADTDDLIENARKYHTAEETDSILKNYLEEHANDEGCAVCFIQYHALPVEDLEEIIPTSILEGRMKAIVQHLMQLNRMEEKQNEANK